MNELTNSFYEIVGDKILAGGLFWLLICTVNFVIRRIWITLVEEKRSLSSKDTNLMLINIGVIILIGMCLSVSIKLINQAQLSKEKSKGYKAFALIIFVLPVTTRSMIPKEFSIGVTPS